MGATEIMTPGSSCAAHQSIYHIGKCLRSNMRDRKWPTRLLTIVVAITLCVVSPARADASMGSSDATLATSLASLKLVNYYPANSVGPNFWLHWDAQQVASDFARAASVSANAIRLVIQPSAFGWPTPTAMMLQRLSATVALAQSAHLKVQLTLFDHWSAWNELQETNTWMRAVVSPYANNPAIAFVELQNEVNIRDYAQINWVRLTLPILESLMGSVPVTVSLSTADPTVLADLMAQLGSSAPEFWDVHYYGQPAKAFSLLAADKAEVAPTPLFVGETGLSSYDPTTGGQDEVAQAQYLAVIEAACTRLGLPPAAPWVLNDFTPTASPGGPMSESEYYFGLFQTNGTPKLAASVVKQYFSTGNIPEVLNDDFTMGVHGELPNGWYPWMGDLASLAFDPSVGLVAPGSLRISDSGWSPLGVPSVYTTPVTQPSAPGQQFRLSAWVKGLEATGCTDVAIAWYKGSGDWIGNSTSSKLPAGTTEWTQLTATGIAPAGTVYLQIYLRSWSNRGTVWFDDVSFSQI